MKGIALILISLFYFSVVCYQENDETLHPREDRAVFEEDGIEHYIHTDKYIYSRGEDVEILYRITNRTESVRLVGDWPNLYAVIPVYVDQNGTEIWRIPTTPYAITEFYLNPHDSCECTLIWDMETWLDDIPVESGIYRVVSKFGGMVWVYIVVW